MVTSKSEKMNAKNRERIGQKNKKIKQKKNLIWVFKMIMDMKI
jgi:hypothetical protein